MSGKINVRMISENSPYAAKFITYSGNKDDKGNWSQPQNKFIFTRGMKLFEYVLVDKIETIEEIPFIFSMMQAMFKRKGLLKYNGQTATIKSLIQGVETEVKYNDVNNLMIGLQYINSIFVLVCSLLQGDGKSKKEILTIEITNDLLEDDLHLELFDTLVNLIDYYSKNITLSFLMNDNIKVDFQGLAELTAYLYILKNKPCPVLLSYALSNASLRTLRLLTLSSIDVTFLKLTDKIAEQNIIKPLKKNFDNNEDTKNVSGKETVSISNKSSTLISENSVFDNLIFKVQTLAMDGCMIKINGSRIIQTSREVKTNMIDFYSIFKGTSDESKCDV